MSKKFGYPPWPKPRAVFLLIKIFKKFKNRPPWDTLAHAPVPYLRPRASQKKTAQHFVQIFAKKVQNPAILKKGQVPDGRHGRKNAYFWKIQKRAPRGSPWACSCKKAKDLDRPNKNGTAFKNQGQKRPNKAIKRPNSRILKKQKKVPLENVPKVTCVKYLSHRMNR